MSEKISEHLFQLIRSLSSHEKRYFKLYASRHTIGDENNYVSLFDAIDEQDEYDEAKIISQFRKEAFVKQFSIAKSRLYNAILRSLDAYHADSSVNSQLKRQLHFAEILFRKTLYGQCSRVLQSAKKLAEKYEKYSTLLEISRMEKELIEKNYYSGKDEAYIQNLLEQDLEILEKMKNHSEYWSIKSNFFHWLNKKGQAKNEKELAKFKKIIDNKLLKGEEKALSTETKYLYFHIYSAYYFAIGDYPKSYGNLKKNAELIEKNVLIFRDEPNIYFSLLTNLIYVAIQLKKIDEAFMYLKKLKEIPATLDTKKNEDLEVRLFSSANSIELTTRILLADFDTAEKLIPVIEKGLSKHKGKFSKVREGLFYLNIAVVYFAQEKPNLALRWINKLLNSPEIAENEDIYCIAQLLNLVIHLELRNETHIPYVFRSTSRFLSKKGRLNKFESRFLVFVQDIMKADTKEKQRKEYQELKEDLQNIFKDPLERSALEYFDFVSWAESKVNRKSYRSIVEERASDTFRTAGKP